MKDYTTAYVYLDYLGNQRQTDFLSGWTLHKLECQLEYLKYRILYKVRIKEWHAN